MRLSGHELISEPFELTALGVRSFCIDPAVILRDLIDEAVRAFVDKTGAEPARIHCTPAMELMFKQHMKEELPRGAFEQPQSFAGSTYFNMTIVCDAAEFALDDGAEDGTEGGEGASE